MKRAVLLFVTLALVLGTDSAFACGDRFIFSGGGGRFDRVSAPVEPANVLIYRDAGTDPTSVMFDPSLPEVLSQAGHTPNVVEETDRWTDTALEADVVLVEYRSAQAVREQLRSASKNAVVVPVLDRAARKDLSAAKREFGVVLNVPASANALLRAIDRALAMH